MIVNERLKSTRRLSNSDQKQFPYRSVIRLFLIVTITGYCPIFNENNIVKNSLSSNYSTIIFNNQFCRYDLYERTMIDND